MNIPVFCVHCKTPVGEMAECDIALNCYEICKPCYEGLKEGAQRRGEE